MEGNALEIHPMIHPRKMNSLLLALLPFLVLPLIVADDNAATDNTEALWKLQYVTKNVDGSKYTVFPWETYLKANEFPERKAETRCAYLYCRMKDDQVCKEQCAVYGAKNVPDAKSTLASRQLTKDNCLKKCACYCASEDSCKDPCQKLCDNRNTYIDNQQYDAEMESFMAESITLTESAEKELFKKLYAYVTSKLDFTGFKFNATRLHWNNLSPMAPRLTRDQNDCYLTYCHMGDHCSDWSKHLHPSFVRYDTIGDDEPQCVGMCKSQCEGAICGETCSRLCNIAFKFEDRAEFDAEARKYSNQLDQLQAEFFMRSSFLVFLSLLALSFLDCANAVEYDAKTIDYLIGKVDFTSFPKINGEFYLNIYKGLILSPSANKLRINKARIIIAQHHCYFSFCHNENKEDCREKCNEFATIPDRKKTESYEEVDTTEQDCVKRWSETCYTDDRKEGCVKRLENLCAIHFSYPDRLQYDREWTQFMQVCERLAKNANPKIEPSKYDVVPAKAYLECARLAYEYGILVDQKIKGDTAMYLHHIMYIPSDQNECVE
ncbi:hypothetical protein PRIPAC_90561, partial [Pristionchus pacificus]|uniref:Uncharacterized protein n=1 Tax=Pristionchus pacificus TaxID=54126 RepID=A0A2A6CYE7_PRIPA